MSQQELHNAFCEVTKFYLVGVNPENDKLLYKFQSHMSALLEAIEADSWIDNPEAEAFLSVRTPCQPMNERLEQLASVFGKLKMEFQN